MNRARILTYVLGGIVVVLAIVGFRAAFDASEGSKPDVASHLVADALESYGLPRMHPGQEMSLLLGGLETITEHPVRLLEIQPIEIRGDEGVVEVLKIRVAPRFDEEWRYPPLGSYHLTPPMDGPPGSPEVCLRQPLFEPEEIVLPGRGAKPAFMYTQFRAVGVGKAVVVIGRVTYEVNGETFVQDVPIEARFEVSEDAKARYVKHERNCAKEAPSG